MIGVITVKVSAHSPQMPLCPAFSFKGSPSSLRIEGVPKSIGTWNITNVFAVIHYPDDVQITKEATRVGNVWVATFDGCATAGKVENGLQIVANGTDEQGNTVNGYVLGAGDIYVMEGDSVIPDPSTTKSYVKLCDTLPTTPSKGDAFIQNGVLVIYDGTSWVPSFDGSLKRDKTDLNVYDYSVWKVSKYQQPMSEFIETYNPPIEFEWKTVELESGETMSLWITKLEVLPDTYLGIDGDAEHVYELSYHGEYLITYTCVPTIDAYKTHITSLTYSDSEATVCEISRSIVEQTDKLAKVSQLPIIPQSYDKIQDSNNNVINANRTVSYDVVSYHWKLYDGYENEYDFTGTKTNSVWQSGADKMQLFMPDSSHWTLQRFFDLGGTWITSWSETIEGSEDDNSMTFHGHGYNGTWYDTHTTTSDELALKSYVDGLIGDIDSVLDTINGEVI